MYKISIWNHDKLIWTAIVESVREAELLWSRWALLRYNKDKTFGCSIIEKVN